MVGPGKDPLRPTIMFFPKQESILDAGFKGRVCPADALPDAWLALRTKAIAITRRARPATSSLLLFAVFRAFY